MCEDISEKLRDELTNEIKKDLCQQYSVNENHRQTIIFTLLGVLISGITAYGITLSNYLKTTDNKALLLFILASCFSIFLFIIPVVFSIINGYTLRRDQLIVNKIRKDSFKDEYDRIFKIYNHTEKSHFSFMQDFNMAVVLFLVIFQFLLTVITIYLVSFIELRDIQYCYIIKSSFILVQVLAFMFSLSIEFIIYICYAYKYKSKQVEFSLKK